MSTNAKMQNTKTPNTDVQSAVALIASATAAAQKLHDVDHELRDRHAVLVAERKTVATAPAAEADVIRNIERLVDAHAAKWQRDRGAGFVRELGGHIEYSGNPVAERLIPPRLPQLARLGPAGPTLDPDALIGLNPAAAKAAFVAAVRASGAPFGLAPEARAARLAELDGQVDELEVQHVALVEAAGAVGIKVELLETVRVRREREASAAERAAELEADRAAGRYVVSGLSAGGRA